MSVMSAFASKADIDESLNLGQNPQVVCVHLKFTSLSANPHTFRESAHMFRALFARYC